MQRKSVVGTRSSLLWLLILGIVVLLIGAVVGALIVLPQLQAARTEQARLAEIERHYQAGIAFQNLEDWSAAEGEYRKVIALDATHRDVQDRMATVRARLKEVAATATTAAEAQAARARAEATATAQAAPIATQQALESHYQKGIAYMNMKQWNEAKAELEQIFAIDPNYKDIQVRLSEVISHLASLTPVPIPVSKSTPTPTATPKRAARYTLNAQDPAGLRIRVSAGDRLTITAAGQVNTHPGGAVTDCDYWTGPNGIASCHYVQEAPELYGLPFMALIAKVDDKWILVGEQASFTVTRDQEILLTVNDWDWGFADNQGSFTIEIKIE
jgi:tetratricopeptide (TPR) repeat protein